MDDDDDYYEDEEGNEDEEDEDGYEDLIDDAEFIVCDLSGERPNVYYELGYAHGSGNEAARILLIAKRDTHLHFDIAPLRVEFYESTEHLRSIISSKLKVMSRITRFQER